MATSTAPFAWGRNNLGVGGSDHLCGASSVDVRGQKCVRAPTELTQSLHQRFHRYYSISFFIPGTLNDMADGCSRLWKLSDAELLSHFDLHYPQTACWRLACPQPKILSSTTCALRRQRPEPESFLHEPNPTTAPGSSGPILPRSPRRPLAYRYRRPHSSPTSVCQRTLSNMQHCPQEQVACQVSHVRASPPCCGSDPYKHGIP
jgi:hypothetical protein